MHVREIYSRVSFCYIIQKWNGRTPTFISIVPHKTSIVELPVLAMVIIWTMRMMEQMVVNRPSRKTVMRAILRRMLICSEYRRGIGNTKMMQSNMMVMAARA